MTTETPKVYAAIAAVTADLSAHGVAKGRKNTQQGYNFRGIDDMYNALSGPVAKHGLCIIPRVLSRNVTERETRNGGALFYITVDVEFDIVAAADGSKHTARVCGEAMDSADKATNKAMSAAYKYLAMQVFCIPTEGDNDADATTHEVKAVANDPRPAPAKAVDPDAVKWGVEAVKEVLEQDLDEVAQCQALYEWHLEFAKDSDLYIAISDKLAADKVITKSQWKAAIAAAKKAA